jgi:hypothetical protein
MRSVERISFQTSRANVLKWYYRLWIGCNGRPVDSVHGGLTPFDTNWKKGSGATPLTTQDLFCGGAISIPTAPTNLIQSATVVSDFETN